jgi:hypothetical protein
MRWDISLALDRLKKEGINYVLSLRNKVGKSCASNRNENEMMNQWII